MVVSRAGADSLRNVDPLRRSGLPKVSAVVPTLGQSPYLERCLRALRRSAEAYGGPVELLLVVPRGRKQQILGGLEGDRQRLVDRLVEVDQGGFSAANNAAFAVAGGELLATVNDDAVVDDQWLDRLVAAMEDPRVAAVQGLNRRLTEPEQIDGWGMGWNRWLQAIQLGHRRPLSEAPSATVEVFGVSATAALYRRSALADVTRAFDPRLFAYYEDVDLAVRLRSSGHRALSVPAALADHAGSITGRRLKLAGRRWIHGNRHLVLARCLGRQFWPRWPWIAGRDVFDACRALAAGDGPGALGIAAGWARALTHMGHYGHLAPAGLDLDSWTGSMGKPYDAQTPASRGAAQAPRPQPESGTDS